MSKPFSTVFAVYDNMTHLDFTGPHQVLCRLPGAQTMIASRDGGDILAEGNLVIGRTSKLSDIEQCDLLCVPGGLTATQIALDEDFVGEVRRLGQGATYVTSVCTGSLILGAAGLLQGKRAACHWAWRELLTEFGAVIEEASRNIEQMAQEEIAKSGGVVPCATRAVSSCQHVAHAERQLSPKLTRRERSQQA